MDARARAHFAAGQARVTAERFEEAYAEFSAGFELSARPLFLFNMAECAFHSGQHEQARRDYRRYLAVDSNGSMAASAHERLEELGPSVEALAVRAPTTQPSPPMIDPTPTASPANALWDAPAFWGIGGAALAVVIAAVIAGVVVAMSPSESECGVGCMLVDLR